MLAGKVPGPDGLGIKFYQDHWNMIKEDIFSAINYFVRMPHDLACTSVLFIPEVNHSEELQHFRPISLCNTINKIVPRVTERWKPVLGSITGKEQSTFLKGRDIIKIFRQSRKFGIL